jgi:DNA topoisomerase I
MVKQMQRLRRGDTAEGMTLERGLELLAGRRAWEAENGPSPKKSRKKAAAKAKPGDTAPTLTKNVVKKAATKRRQRKQQPAKLRKPQRKVKRTP